MPRIQYELTRLPKKSGGVRYEPVASAELVPFPTTALYVEQSFLAEIMPPTSEPLATEAGFPQTIWVTVEVE